MLAGLSSCANQNGLYKRFCCSIWCCWDIYWVLKSFSSLLLFHRLLSILCLLLFFHLCFPLISVPLDSHSFVVISPTDSSWSWIPAQSASCPSGYEIFQLSCMGVSWATLTSCSENWTSSWRAVEDCWLRDQSDLPYHDNTGREQANRDTRIHGTRAVQWTRTGNLSN